MSAPDLSTLAQRMRYAADVIDEYTDFSPTLSRGQTFAAHNLRIAANRAEIEEQRRVDVLAKDLFEAGWKKVTTAAARLLVDAGWRKGDRS